MGILNKIKRMWNQGSVTDEKMWNSALWNLAGQNTSGENINEYTALTYSAVYNAISLISGTIGALPLHLYQKKEKTRVYATNHNLYRVMHTAANEYMTAMAMRECLMSHALSWGNGYAEKVMNRMGKVVELWPIPPNRVKPKMVDGELKYEITVDGEIFLMGRDKVLHVPGMGFDGFMGYSIVSLAAQAIGLGKAMETFGANYFGNGTHPGVVVSHPGKIGQAAYDNLKSSLITAHSGLGKSHKLMLLEESMKIENMGIPPNDSQFLESRQFQITDIARWFNLPVHKLKEMTKSSFNNIESEQQSFVIDSLLPWSVRLEQNYNMQLLSPAEYKSGLYFKHIFEGLLRGNSKDRAEFYSKMWRIGAFSINDIRGKEDLDPIENGDMHLIPQEMMPLEDAGKQFETEGLPPISEVEDKMNIKILPQNNKKG